MHFCKITHLKKKYHTDSKPRNYMLIIPYSRQHKVNTKIIGKQTEAKRKGIYLAVWICFFK